MKRYMGEASWGYVSEGILTGLVYLFLVQWLGSDKLARFVSSTANSWAYLIGLLSALSVALFALFVHILSTEFGDWLCSRGADGVYKAAFMYTLCVNVLTFCSLIAAGYSKRALAAYVALGLLIYALTNFVSTVKNVSDLLKLQRLFRLSKSMPATRNS